MIEYDGRVNIISKTRFLDSDSEWPSGRAIHNKM